MFLLQTASLMILLFLISGVVGYLFSRLTKMSSYMPSVFMVTLPIYIISGFQILMFSLTAIGLLAIGLSALFVIVIAVSFLCLIFLYFEVKNKTLLVTPKSFIRFRFLSIENIVPLFLFSTIFWFFLNKMSEMLWPPVGDVLGGHGPYVSNLLFNGRLTISLEPLAPKSIFYPPGFHVFAANIASWFNLLPGEAVLLLAGLTIILVFWLIYSLTYMYTRSKLLSSAVFLSPFVFHPSGHLSRWIVGFFYNGTYPSLLAILLAMFSIVILALLDSYVEHNERLVLGITLWQLVTMLTLLVEYPSFLPVVMLTLIYLLFRHHSMYRSVFIKNYKIIAVLLIVILLILVLTLIYFENEANALFSRVWRYYIGGPSLEGTGGFKREISFSYFYDHITGFAMIIAFAASFLYLLSKKYTSIAFMYFFSFILLVLSLIDPVTLGTDIFLRIVHQRFHMILWLASWTMIALGIYDLMNRLNIANKRIIKIDVRLGSSISEKKFNIYSRSIVFSLCFFALTALFIPSIIYQYERNPNWYTAKESWTHDYEGLLWIHNNVPPNDLILNDYSWAGLWILSFSYKNTTSNYFNSLSNLNRTLELNEIWKGQMPAYEVYDLLKKYNVSYVFTTSEWGYYRWWKLTGEKAEYVGKPLSPSQYIGLFSSYPFLKLSFQSGNTAIYEVKHTVTYTLIESLALNFDGVDDYVWLGSPESLKVSRFTIAAWVKTNWLSPGPYAQRIYRWYPYGNCLRFGPSGRIAVFYYDSAGNLHIVESSSSYADKQWHFAVGTFDGSYIRLYVDGVEVASEAHTADVYYGAGGAAIGREGYVDLYRFDGLIDEARIFNRALTEEEIQYLYENRSLSNTTGLVMELLFDEGKGDVAYDTSGTLNHGTIYGATYTPYQIMFWTEEP